MSKQERLVAGTIAGASIGVLILACSNSSTPPPSNGNPNDPTPPNTTPVANAPYATCPGTPLDPGSFTFNGSGTYPVPATTSCSPAGTPTAGTPDSHCVGQTPQTVSGGSCSAEDAGPPASEDAGPPPSSDAGAGDAGSEDAAPPPSDDAGAPGPCGENGSDYGATMYGTEADDDDCKYHVSYTASPICENNGTYFIVTANYLTQNSAPLTGASTFAELCLSDSHPAPAIDARPQAGKPGKQQVVEGPPGTYTIGPVEFDAPGDWTVRFHFNEFCCDIVGDSPHGHAAFHVTVP